MEYRLEHLGQYFSIASCLIRCRYRTFTHGHSPTTRSQ